MALDFTRAYESDRQLTQRLFKDLGKNGILAGQTAQYTPPGTQDNMPFAQYFGVDEKKLAEMPDAEFLQIRKSGILPAIYAHLLSLGNWRSLIGRRMRRYGVSELEAATGQKLA